MEIDFGGIGKEYAVDSALRLLSRNTDDSFLVNFGGDCHARRPLADGSAWMTGIENPHRAGDANAVIQLKRGSPPAATYSSSSCTMANATGTS